MILSIVEFESDIYKQMLHLRDEVLRKPLGLSLDIASLGNEKESIHIAGFEGNALQCCLLLTPLGNNSVQMRQVAVITSMQSKGLGKELVLFSEKIAGEKGFKEIVLHARKNVVGFYEKLGYQTYGDEYIEVTIPHISMKKNL